MQTSLISVPAKESPEKALSRAIKVPHGETVISKKHPLHTHVGASIAVCLYDTKTNAYGLRQVMLPSLAQGHRNDASLQADAAMEDVFTQLCPAGQFSAFDVKRKRILAKIFGGAVLKASGHCHSDGWQNARFVRKWLEARNVPVIAEHIGGSWRREIVLLPSNGVVYCRTHALDDNFLNEEHIHLTAIKEEPNKIELF